MLNRRQFAAAVTMASLGSGSAIGAAEKFPSRPIKIVFPIAPGSGIEAVVRHIASKMSERLGQPVIIEHRPGGNAQIGITYVAKAVPDGYTLGVGLVTNLSLAPHTFKTLPYDPLKDLAPVALVATNYLALVSRPDAPVAGVSEMGQWARSTSSGLSVGTTSVGGLPHLAFEQLARMGTAGMPYTVVTYAGNSQLLQDLIGGRLDVAMFDFSSAIEMAQGGKLRILGITNPARDPRVPSIPAISEVVKGYEAVGWIGLIAPAGTPAPIIRILNESIVAAIATPDVQAAMATFALIPAPGTPEDFAVWLRQEDKKFGALVKQVDFKPQ